MANSYFSYTADGTTDTFTAPPYIEPGHINVFVDDIAVSFTWVNSSQVKLDAVPASGSFILVKRNTPRERIVDYTTGSTLKASYLNLDARQTYYILQELQDAADITLSLDLESFKWDAKGNVIKNVGTPAANSDAVTKYYVDTLVAGGAVDGYCPLDGDARIPEQYLTKFKQTPSLPAGRDLMEKMKDIISVKDFGAIGDGVADDTASIQAAIDYAESIATEDAIFAKTGVGVFFPHGVYKITSTLTLRADGVGLYGPPGRGAILQMNATPQTCLIVGDETEVKNTWGVQITNLTFFCISPQSTVTTAIKVFNCGKMLIRDCWFQNWYISIDCAMLSTSYIHHCWFHQGDRTVNKAAASIRLRGRSDGHNSNGNHITDCEFWGNENFQPSTEAHLLIQNSDGLYVTQCHIYQARYDVHITPDGTVAGNYISDIMFNNCYFDECFEACVRVAGSVVAPGIYQNIKFADCLFRSARTAFYGLIVSVEDAPALKNISIVGGTVKQARGVGVAFIGDTSSRVEVEGAIISGVLFELNNSSGSTTNPADIYAEVNSISVTGCVFLNPDSSDTSKSVSINPSILPYPENPSAVIVGNDFSKASHYQSFPVFFSSQNGSNILVANNADCGEGTTVNNRLFSSQNGDYTNTLHEYSIPVGQTGVVKALVVGRQQDGNGYAYREISGIFNRTKEGVSSWIEGPTVVKTYGANFTPAPVVAMAISNNKIKLTTVGSGSTGISWYAEFELKATR